MRKQDYDNVEDFTECKKIENCDADVVQCVANNAAHWWWGSDSDFRKSMPEVFEPTTATFALNDEIISFFDRI